MGIKLKTIRKNLLNRLFNILKIRIVYFIFVLSMRMQRGDKLNIKNNKTAENGANISKPLILGILSSFFFSFTFILNRSMSLSGSSYLWSGVLRYFFVILILFIYLFVRGELNGVFKSIRANKLKWFIYSNIGFSLFYFALSISTVYGESWLAASFWQLTIVFGMLLTPLFGEPVPIKPLIFSGLIILGVVLLQMENAKSVNILQSTFTLVSMSIAAVSYPFGNRSMLRLTKDSISSIQRVFGMALMTVPFWIIVSVYALNTVGPPTSTQVLQTFLIAVSSGVIATVLFFKATGMVKDDLEKLAVVETTQSTELIFTLLTGIILLKDPLPSTTGFIGISFIIVGMILCALAPSMGRRKKEIN